MRFRALIAAVALLGLLSGNARAQDDTALADRSALLQRIQDRFSASVREQLGLSDVQAAKMKETTATWFLKRRDLEGEERRLRQAMAAQLRPGVAASRDSVSRLIDKLLTVRIEYAETFRGEDRELSSYLDPVQRGQYFVLRERLLDRAQAARQERQLNNRRRLLR